MHHSSSRSRGENIWLRESTVLLLLGVTVLVLTLLNSQPAPAEADEAEGGGAAVFASQPPIIGTHLYELQPLVVEVEPFRDRGGGIEPLGDKLLLVTPRGRIALVDANGHVNYLDGLVPMNEPDLEALSIRVGFRVADILLHQQSQDRFTLFVSHHHFAGDCIDFRVSSTQLLLRNGKSLLSGRWETVFTTNPCIPIDLFSLNAGSGGIQIGGRMVMDGDNHLLVAIGNNAWHMWNEISGRPVPLSTYENDYQLGKLVRIDLTGGETEIVARGLRNPQGLARDVHGNLWESEHGPEGGDELNLLKPGRHYGWPYVTHGVQYGKKIWPFSEVQGRHDEYEKPVFSWVPSIAVSNLIVSRSQQFPLWNGDLLIGSLKSQSLFRARLNNQRVTYVEKIEVGERIRDITQLPDGRVALLADSARIIFLQRAPIYCQEQNDLDQIYTSDADHVCIDLSTAISQSGNPSIRALDGAQLDKPIIRSLFNVYIESDKIVYLKSPCAPSDLSHLFLLHIAPAHRLDLREESHNLGVNLYDFSTDSNDAGFAFTDDVCVAVRTLPTYEIQRIYTGQALQTRGPDGEPSFQDLLWDGSHTFEEHPFSSDEIAKLAVESNDIILNYLQIDILDTPAVRSRFDIYISGSWLLYTKSRCSGDDLTRRFFLHITPLDSANLAVEHEAFGFNEYDFNASDNFVGTAFNESGCVVARVLPQYGIAHINTGQVIRVENQDGSISWKGPVWDASFDPRKAAYAPEEEDSLSAYTDEQGIHPGAALFAAHCVSCHNLTPEHNVGPHLHKLVGRRAGHTDGYNASAALDSLGIIWTQSSLTQFIASPSRFAPGTTMTDVGITEDEAVLIADFLASALSE